MSVKSSRLSNTNYGQICLYKMGRSWIRILKFLSLIRIQNTGLNKNILTRFLKSNVIFFSLFYVPPEPPKSLHPEPIKRKGRLRHTAGTFRYSGSTTLVYVKIAKSYKQPQKGLFCSGWELSVLITVVKYAFFMFHRVFSALRMVEPFQGQRCNMNVHIMAIFKSTLGFSNFRAMDPHYFLGIRIQQGFFNAGFLLSLLSNLFLFLILIKLQLLIIFLHFFSFSFLIFPSWIRIPNADPDRGGKMNADPDPRPCSSRYRYSMRLWNRKTGCFHFRLGALYSPERSAGSEQRYGVCTLHYLDQTFKCGKMRPRE